MKDKWIEKENEKSRTDKQWSEINSVLIIYKYDCLLLFKQIK